MPPVTHEKRLFEAGATEQVLFFTQRDDLPLNNQYDATMMQP